MGTLGSISNPMDEVNKSLNEIRKNLEMLKNEISEIHTENKEHNKKSFWLEEYKECGKIIRNFEIRATQWSLVIWVGIGGLILAGSRISFKFFEFIPLLFFLWITYLFYNNIGVMRIVYNQKEELRKELGEELGTLKKMTTVYKSIFASDWLNRRFDGLKRIPGGVFSQYAIVPGTILSVFWLILYRCGIWTLILEALSITE